MRRSKVSAGRTAAARFTSVLTVRSNPHQSQTQLHLFLRWCTHLAAMDERGTQTRSTTGLGRPRRRSPPSPPVAALAAGGHLCFMLARRMQQRVRRLQLPRRWSQFHCDGRSCGGEDHRTRALEDELTSEPRQGLNRRTPSVLQTLLKKLQPLDGKASSPRWKSFNWHCDSRGDTTADAKCFNLR